MKESLGYQPSQMVGAGASPLFSINRHQMATLLMKDFLRWDPKIKGEKIRTVCGIINLIYNSTNQADESI